MEMDLKKLPTEMDSDALWNVMKALGGQNVGQEIMGCSIKDVKHAVEILECLLVLEDLKPGLFLHTFHALVPGFIKERNRLELATAAQRAADRDGFGKEWAEAIRAGSTPRKKGYVAAMTLVYQAATGSDINAAAAAAADHFGIDPESALKAVRRYKKKT